MTRALVAIAILGLTACADLYGDRGPSACDGLALDACRHTAGCAADLCTTCGCTPTFEGCRAAGAAPAACPEVDCAQPQCCADEAGCGGQLACVTPDDPPACGACNSFPGDCTSDAGCAPGSICQPIACSCQGERACVPGCTAGSCPADQACDPATARCQARACDAAGPACPANFECRGGRCLRAACASDLDCPVGFCVEGACRAELGVCTPPVA